MKKIFVLLSILIFASCSKDDSKNTAIDSITINDLSGTLNLFPLALNPEFTSVSEVNIGDNSLVGVVRFGNTIKVFPYVFMTHNEIVNDTQQGLKYAFSYCPITKSSVAFKRNGVFRASGYLLNDNLTPWDEKTETIWSQMLLKGIIGEKENIQFNTIPVLETKWKTVKDFFPNAKVVTAALFSTRISPPDDDDSSSGTAPELNDFVYGIVTGSRATIFKYADFSDTILINKTIQGKKYIVYGNLGRRVMSAFEVDSFDNYTSISGEFPYVFKNVNGIKFDIFGRGTNGTTLENPKFAYVAIWKAWLDFYENFEFED